MDADGPGWIQELRTASGASDASGVPVGHNRARELAVTLAKLGLTVGFGDLEYDSGKFGIALADYTRFMRQLTRMIRNDCT